MTDNEDFDGCARACRKAGVHTLVWGDCAHAPESARPEPRVTIGGTYIAADGYPAIGLESIPVSELAERIEKTLRTVPTSQIRPSDDEYAAMALVVALNLAGEQQ